MILRAISCGVVACALLGVGPAAAGMAAPLHATSLPIVDVAVTKPKETTGTTPLKAGTGMQLLPGSGSREPINVNSDTLDFLNRENKLVYTGHVVAAQGGSTLKASRLDIDLDRTGSGGTTRTPAVAAPPAAGSSTVRHMEADGPVTLTSKDQVGTGDHATYDKAENKVYLKGNVTLTQTSSIIQGDSLVYDMSSGQARVSGNVRSLFNQPEAKDGAGAGGQADRTSRH